MKRILHSVLGNSQRLDGGAMFGNAPRALWERWITPDAANRIPLACRALLVTEIAERASSPERRVLLETGIGAFFPPELRERFGVVEDRHALLESLAARGLRPEDIDVVVLSHLHFDHAGGLLTPWDEGRPLTLAFPRATFVVGREAFERARRPHARDRASFIPELLPLLEASGRLSLVDGRRSDVLGPDYALHYSEGHTPGLMLVEVPGADGPLVFGGDLVPGAAWVHLPITMGYDRYPERLIDEKHALFEDLLARRGRLFFTHDVDVAMGRLVRDERGRFGVTETMATIDGVEA